MISQMGPLHKNNIYECTQIQTDTNVSFVLLCKGVAEHFAQ
jgi:hypothetical protein